MTGRSSTGVTGLDEILGGGFPSGQMYLIDGNPGAGKTTLGLQFLRAGVALGKRCAYVVLSESERALRRLAASHGWSLDGITVIESNDQDPASDYSIYQPSEVELGESARALVDQLAAVKPELVVIDSLAEMRLIAQDPLRYRRQLLALRRFFDQNEMTVLLLDFATDRESDHQLESLCHGIVHLHQLAPEYGGQRRRLRVAKLRESNFRDGFHDFAIQMGGLNVFPRLVAAEHGRDRAYIQDTLSSGVPELDRMMGGGVDRGTSTLVLGPAGAGKSTLTAQFAKAAVARGEKVAFFIFDEVPSTLVIRGEGMGMGVANDISAGRILIRQVDPAELAPGQFAQLVRDAVERDGAAMVVIDSVNGYHSAMPDEHHLAAHLHELLAFLNQRNVATLLVMTQSGLVGDNTSPIDLSYLTDSVLLLRYFEAEGEIRQAISMVKRRTGPHERSIRELRLDASGVRVGDPLRDFHGILGGSLVYVGRTPMMPSRDVQST
ncbi:MAG: gas vesicle protein GvpD [Kofleriaceae bacterium]